MPFERLLNEVINAGLGGNQECTDKCPDQDHDRSLLLGAKLFLGRGIHDHPAHGGQAGRCG